VSRIRFAAWRTQDGFAGGTHQGTRVDATGLRTEEPAGVRHYTDPHAEHAARRGYRWSAWVSPEVRPGFGFTSLVPSWNASTPGRSWLEVEARVSEDGVHWSRWYALARWAESDVEVRPTSTAGQDDEQARVETDLLCAPDEVTWTAYQLRVVLLAPEATPAPSVRLLGAVAARLTGEPPTATPPGGEAWGTELPVPPYSQQLHRGQYPQWDSGGESWCSPTSTSMVLGRWGRGPTPAEYAWVRPELPDRFVVHAARSTFDHAYGGAGNWSFNVAYAGRFGTEAFVTRLRSLAEAERFIAAGIPLVASVAFTREQLAGAHYDTEGHLLTIIGFDERGDVICNDPASHERPSNDAVRVVYDREQFERVWLGGPDGPGGTVYVVHPPDVPLPRVPDPAEPNW
jgi:hypothetical protein